jgi:hypothetical protein
MTERVEKDHRAFVKLAKIAESYHWLLEVHMVPAEGAPEGVMPVIVLCTDGEDDAYSRRVELNESFDRCAEIILDALKRGRVI